ncbi:MAG: phosphate acetyltransferase [Bacteroidetes bacterium GWA2_30_7]|nr:MAG: phosphate acetyltransferase [Bacteroidetes bacterium GWA2_30_7]
MIREKAKLNKRHIVLPEGTSERTLRAAEIIIQENLAKLTLLGNIDEIRKLEKSLHLNLSDVQIIDPSKSPKYDLYVETFYNLRKGRGVSKDEAAKTISEDIYYGPMMIYMGDADGEVSGAEHTTADTVRPALQIVKTAPCISVVSGAMVMLTKKPSLGQNGIFIFADVAITANPTALQLAEIAICSANTAKSVAGIENPKVAMLSFSTKGSAEHELVTKVIEATKIAREMSPDLQIDGELQADASLIPSIGIKKSPGSTVAGHANVLIFPDLQSGNIAYKLVERLGDAEAIGPILQGLGAPINDLSRGCSVEDIVNLVAITVNQCIK